MTVTNPGLSADARALMLFESQKRSAGLSYVLWFLLGGLGAHRFYNGRAGSGVAILLLNVAGWVTLVVGVGVAILFAVGVWVIVDAFLIPGWIRQHNAELMMRLERIAG